MNPHAHTTDAHTGVSPARSSADHGGRRCAASVPRQGLDHEGNHRFPQRNERQEALNPAAYQDPAISPGRDPCTLRALLPEAQALFFHPCSDGTRTRGAHGRCRNGHRQDDRRRARAGARNDVRPGEFWWQTDRVGCARFLNDEDGGFQDGRFFDIRFPTVLTAPSAKFSDARVPGTRAVPALTQRGGVMTRSSSPAGSHPDRTGAAFHGIRSGSRPSPDLHPKREWSRCPGASHASREEARPRRLSDGARQGRLPRGPSPGERPRLEAGTVEVMPPRGHIARTGHVHCRVAPGQRRQAQAARSPQCAECARMKGRPQATLRPPGHREDPS